MAIEWLKIEAGHYIATDGSFTIQRGWAGGIGDDFAADPTSNSPQEEWFLYNKDGNMIDGYPTMREAKQIAERRR